MIVTFVFTGHVEDGVGLRKLREILMRWFAAARRAEAEVLDTAAKLPDRYTLDLTDDNVPASIAGSSLLVFRPDPCAKAWAFVVTVVAGSKEFTDGLRREFLARGVDAYLKKVGVQELSAGLVTTIHA